MLRRARGPRARRARAAAARDRAARPERTCSPRPRAPPRSRSATAPCCWSRRRRRPSPSASRRGPTSPARPRPRDVAAKFRLSMTPDRRGRRGRAAGRDRARRETRPTPDRPRPRRAPGVLARGSASSPRGSPPGYRWEDLVRARAPARAAAARSPPTCATATACSRDWGYEQTVARTQGLKVLFAGESGTGKTMAAQVLAARARAGALPRRPRHDRARSTSGRPRRTSTGSSAPPRAPTRSCSSTRPTRCSASAPRSSDSHDRYANIEVAYLLQKMEGYPGAVILATNFRRNIDDAFVRRLDFVIDFPFPEAEDRERIWRLRAARRGAASPTTSTSTSSPTQFKLSGGAIRNCSLAAAFQAADEGARDRDAPPRARRRAGVRQAGPADARGRLRALPRADPRAGAERRPPRHRARRARVPGAVRLGCRGVAAARRRCRTGLGRGSRLAFARARTRACSTAQLRASTQRGVQRRASDAQVAARRDLPAGERRRGHGPAPRRAARELARDGHERAASPAPAAGDAAPEPSRGSCASRCIAAPSKLVAQAAWQRRARARPPGAAAASDSGAPPRSRARPAAGRRPVCRGRARTAWQRRVRKRRAARSVEVPSAMRRASVPPPLDLERRCDGGRPTEATRAAASATMSAPAAHAPPQLVNRTSAGRAAVREHGAHGRQARDAP